jgi:hypothetical protein
MEMELNLVVNWVGFKFFAWNVSQRFYEFKGRHSQLGFQKGVVISQRIPNDNFGFFSYLHHLNVMDGCTTIDKIMSF